MKNLKVINAEIKVLSETIDSILDLAEINNENNKEVADLLNLAETLCCNLNLAVNQLKQQLTTINNEN